MPFKYPPIEKRLWEKVDKSGECWLWTGTVSMGYGKIMHKGKSEGVHRVSYELEYGEIPDGMDVCHNCPSGDNPLCVRPTHLWLGTHQENMKDRNKKGRGAVWVGDNHPYAKLNSEKVREIRKLHSQGVSQQELAKQFNVTGGAIHSVVTGKNWKHVA